MINASEIKEHAEIIGSDGKHVGTVDHVEGNRIKLTKRDSGTGKHEGHHHFIDLSSVAAVEGGRVKLSLSSKDAMANESERDGRRVQ